MSEIFISYAREDRQAAQSLASILKARDFSIWWDRKIPPGKTFDEVIQEALDRAQCVVVLWSRASIESDFVKDEAQRAANRDILVPALIEDVRIPLGFGRLQTANLIDWQGDPAHPEFDRLLRSLASTVGRPMPSKSMILTPPEVRRIAENEPGEPHAARSPAARSHAARLRGRTAMLSGVALVLVAAAVAGWMLNQRKPAPPPAQGSAEPAAQTEPAVPDLPEPADPGDSGSEVPRPPDGEAGAPPEIDIAGALAEIERRGADPSVRDEDLVEELRRLSADGTALEEQQAKGILAKIASLEASIDQLAELEAMGERADRTLRAQLEAWRDFVPARQASPAATRRESRLAELDELARSSATIADPKRFVTCRGVREDAEGKAVAATGIADVFPPGPVHLFARVRAPRAEETLRLEWRDGEGKVAKAHDVTVYRNEQPGYRIHYYRQLTEPGPHEVRLYNQSGALIGRRRFEITAGAPAAPRFVDSGDVVTDSRTGLTWTRREISGGEGIRWDQAMKNCRDLDLARRGGWRLPSLAELETLRGASATASRGGLELKSLGLIWSSEQGGNARAMQLDFSSGERVESRTRRKKGAGALCVTGG